MLLLFGGVYVPPRALLGAREGATVAEINEAYRHLKSLEGGEEDFRTLHLAYNLLVHNVFQMKRCHWPPTSGHGSAYAWSDDRTISCP